MSSKMGVGCVICTEEFSQQSDENSVVLKYCGHVFHNSCLKSWLERSKTCPVCRHYTIDTPSYVGRVHLQRLSLDNRAVNNLLEETFALKNKLKIKELELKKKEEELEKKDEKLKRAENINKELEGTLKEVKTHTKKIHEAIKILNNPIMDVKEEDLSVVEVPLSSSCVLPRRPIVRTARAPLVSCSSISAAPTRPIGAITRTVRQVGVRGRVASSSALNTSRRS